MNKEIKQKLVKNIKDIYFYIYTVLILIMLVFFSLFKNDFINVLTANKKTIGMIAPFGILLFVLYKKSLKKYLNKGEFFTIFSILLALLFFSFEITNEKIQEKNILDNKLSTILATTRNNCRTAKDAITALRNRNDSYKLSTYSTNIYEDNFNILYNKYGEKKGDDIIEAVLIMKAANALINVVINFDAELALAETPKVAATIRENMTLRNNDIADRSVEIHKLLCDIIEK